MSDLHRSSYYLNFSILGIVAFSVPVVVFLYNPQFSHLWLLYIGNFLLMAVVFTAVMVYNKRSSKKALSSLLQAGLRITFTTVVFSLLMAEGMWLLDKHPNLLHAPANTVIFNSNNLFPILFMDSTLVNIFAGAFAALLASVTLFWPKK
jgi:hypothetical protein